MCKIVMPPEKGLSPVFPDADWCVVGEPFFGIPVSCYAMESLEEPGEAFQVLSEAEFAAQEDVKMLAHNGLHAFLAFLGTLRGKEYFCELREDLELMSMTGEMMREEVGRALLRKHGKALNRNFWHNYAPTITRRITCPGFHDPVSRGTRGVLRKLQPWERLIGGMRTIWEQGIEPRLYGIGVAAAVIRAVESGETEKTFRQVLEDHCDLADEPELVELCLEGRAWCGRE
ncbi:MAG: hypothetical protein KGZ25_04995, partial [Planctomycetes bacterium]|nr:hypothetical protein [Planctomycetota bacterium]